MQWISSAALIIISACVPMAFGAIASIAGPRAAFAAGTVLLLIGGAALPVTWPGVATASVGRLRIWRGAVVGAAGLLVLGRVTALLLPAVFSGPLDPNRGDMLVIIEHAIAAFLEGGNPYGIHHVPWDAPLSYGPPLWMPYIVPHLLNADLRILSLAAQLVVPAVCIAAAARRAAGGELLRPALLFALGATLALSPDIRGFHSIGHTQIYWPLLLFFCLLMAGSRWTLAAICLGLLVAARTTLVALMPVFFLYLATNRLLRPRHVAAFICAAALPFLPFVLADAASVRYAMFGVYLKVIKGFVWHSTTWATQTYGLTGRLLEHGLERYAEVAQLASLAIVYALAWRSFRRGARPEPWMGLALLVFSMTTLWSVIYLYFDVWILMASALVARDGIGTSNLWRSIGLVAVAFVAMLALVLFVAARQPGSAYTLDIGDPSTSGFTGGGFGRDEAVKEGDRLIVWIEGTTARIRVPRAGWRSGTIRIAIRPNMPAPGMDQRVLATLNGWTIANEKLHEGWQEITFTGARRRWRYGFNLLDLHFGYAVPPGGAGGDGRALSAAIDWVRIE